MDVFGFKPEGIKDIKILCVLGGYHFLQGDVEKALNFYSIASNLCKSEASIICNLGWVYLKLHMYDRSKESFEKAIDLNAKHAWSELGIARILKINLKKK